MFVAVSVDEPALPPVALAVLGRSLTAPGDRVLRAGVPSVLDPAAAPAFRRLFRKLPDEADIEALIDADELDDEMTELIDYARSANR